MNERPPITNLATFEGLDDADRAHTIGKLIVEVHDWLAKADDDKTPVWEFSSTRAYAADLVTAITRLSLNTDLRLDALLVLRLAERAVGKAVRRDQAAGELGSLATNNPGHNQHQNPPAKKLPSPTPYVGIGTTAHLIYQMTDNVTDAQFNAALQQAKSEGRLSRANVVRKIIEARTGKKIDTRRDLVEQSRDLAEQLRKVTLKLRKLHDDDRLERNKPEVAARMRFYLADAEAVCAELRKTLDEE